MIRAICFMVLSLVLFSQAQVQAHPQKKIDHRKVTDVTDRYAYRANVLSAFDPRVVEAIPTEENEVLVAAFHFQTAPKPGMRISSDSRYQARIEVYYTAGDWMNYGFVYFVTDAAQCRVVNGKDECLGIQKAYYIPKLSTTDKELGKVPPELDVFAKEELISPLLMKFIQNEFLTPDGFVNSNFTAL